MMRVIISLVFMLTMAISSYSATDSVMCFSKKEALTIVNKIRLLQDSLAYSSAIITNQDSLISKYDKRIFVYKQQLDNRDQAIEVYKRQSEIMEQTIKDLQPKWYDNKFLWFGGGVVAALVTVILIN